MDIQLNQLIIHELQKETDSGEVYLFLTEKVVPIDDRAYALLEKLNHSFYQKEDLLQGYLSTPEDALFPGYFQDLIDKGFAEESFLSFSRETMNALKLSLNGVIGAKGGYLVYADYEQFGTRLLGLFLVRDTEGIVFQKDQDRSTFELDAVTYLNTDKLAMACRIDVERFKSGNTRCMELIKHAKSQKEISDYFLNWVGLDRPESSKDLTGKFLQMVTELPLPVDEETGEAVQEDEFREQILQFAMKSPTKTISVNEFDQTFYGEEKTAQQYIQENELTLENDFRFDRNMMRKFYNYRVSADGVSLNFTRKHLSTRQVEIEGGSIVIRSDELVRKIMEMMELDGEGYGL